VKRRPTGTRFGSDEGAVDSATPREPGRPAGEPSISEVRLSDLEPYTGLRYLSKLFRVMAVIMLPLLVVEVGAGFYTQGAAAIPTLLGEGSRLIVIAGVLWGTGDLADLLIAVGHDVRAARVMLARMERGGPSPFPDSSEGAVRGTWSRRAEVVVPDRSPGHRDAPADMPRPSRGPTP